MSTAPKYEPHYTVDDYRLWEGHWELCGGTAVSMTPSPFGPHERLVSRIAQSLMNQIDDQACNCVVYTNLDWIVSNDTVVRPDLMVVCGDQPDEHLQKAPSLILEVLSPSTAGKDRVYKRELFQREGVPYYLLGDPNEKSLELLKLDHGRYENADSWTVAMEFPDGCTLTMVRDRLFS